MSAHLLEPWMRGPIPDVHPLVAPALYALEHTREDLERWTDGLTAEQLWTSVSGLAPVGFHLRHIAGSTDRLMTYALGGQLDDAQIARLKSEDNWAVGNDRKALIDEVTDVFAMAETALKLLDPTTLVAVRGIGRKRLPTTVIGLLQHIGEHNLRHVGQVITTVKVLRHS